MKIKHKIGFGVLIMSILLIAFSSAHMLFTFSGGDWVCVANECKEWITGEDWAREKCFLKDGIDMCTVNLEGVVQDVPLAEIDLKNIRSCAHEECVAKIYMKVKHEVFKDEE